MTRWEYMVHSLWFKHTASEIQEMLCSFGLSGWELATTFENREYIRYIFKRPLPPEANHEEA